MKPTDLTLDEQMRLTAFEIEKRKGLLDITEEDAIVIHEVKPVIVDDLHDIVEDFYEKLVEIEGVAELIGDAETLFRLKNHLKGYLRSLFDGQYDTEYVQTRLRIGLVHKRIGVPTKLYVAAYRILSSVLRDRLGPKTKDDCTRCNRLFETLDKLMLFDLALVFDTYILGLVNEVKRGREELEEYAHDLEQTIADRTRQLAEQAQKDGMTGLYNQKTFFGLVRREISRAERQAEELCLCYIDLDHFKQANDTLGHKYGDAVLVNVAKAMHQVLRDEDIGARYGGDEFCVLLPHTVPDEAVGVSKRLHKAFADIDPKCMVTMSIGISHFTPGSGLDTDALIKLADKAMYASKEKQGHVVTVYAEDL